MPFFCTSLRFTTKKGTENMKIQYKFIDETVEIEVEEDWGNLVIDLDRQELALAEWHFRDAIPTKDDHTSITREMIRVFDEGREPK